MGADDMTRGFIIPIGGAEERLNEGAILRRFAKLCGGKSAHIAILPTASQQKDTGQRYEACFRDIGVAEARALPIEERAEARRQDWLEYLERCDGAFLTGGNQLRLSTTLGGTPVAKVLRKRNEAGMHVGGTSAGAAFLSEHMIAFGEEGSTPHADSVTLAPGLGLTNRVIVDQHFRQRDRIGRLLTAISYNPYAIGLGLDEDTAAFIGPDDVLTVVGSGGVTIVDASELEYTSMDHAQKHQAVSLIGIKLHILVSGATYNLHTREAVPATAEPRG